LQPNPARRLRLAALAAARHRSSQKQVAALARSLRLVWLAVSLAGVPLASEQKPRRLLCLPLCARLKMSASV
jgi:hypothetical protein